MAQAQAVDDDQQLLDGVELRLSRRGRHDLVAVIAMSCCALVVATMAMLAAATSDWQQLLLPPSVCRVEHNTIFRWPTAAQLDAVVRMLSAWALVAWLAALAALGFALARALMRAVSAVLVAAAAAIPVALAFLSVAFLVQGKLTRGSHLVWATLSYALLVAAVLVAVLLCCARRRIARSAVLLKQVAGVIVDHPSLLVAVMLVGEARPRNARVAHRSLQAAAHPCLDRACERVCRRRHRTQRFARSLCSGFSHQAFSPSSEWGSGASPACRGRWAVARATGRWRAGPPRARRSSARCCSGSWLSAATPDASSSAS